jgi:ElaB/YqjD/DUF883 family membrane-anchored ribosome-binding protein
LQDIVVHDGKLPGTCARFKLHIGILVMDPQTRKASLGERLPKRHDTCNLGENWQYYRRNTPVAENVTPQVRYIQGRCSVADNVDRNIDNAANKAKDAADRVKDKAEELGEKAKHRVQEAGTAIGNKVKDVGRKIKDATH